MAKQNEQQIHDDIIQYIQKEGGTFSNWYVGITSYPKQRLFIEHNVPEKNYWWIYREAYNSESARKVEKFIINNYGTDGGSGGGDNNSVFVYAYRKSNVTIQ